MQQNNLILHPDQKKLSKLYNRKGKPELEYQPHKKKTEETCRFFARGHCTRGAECRFDHPTICKKFRQFGNKSVDPKGCEGNCQA